MAQVMIDIAGTALTAEDKQLLAHPDVNGLILFTRNFSSIEQVETLVADARAASNGPLLVAVDHEGGRVQRFRDGFSAIPAMARIADLPEQEQLAAAQDLGWLMAREVRAVGIDISFAPVLDINGCSEVIGDRAFAREVQQVAHLAQAFIEGMHEAGMGATGKHFPGHGSVVADSHFAVPVDSRSKEDIFNIDLPVFDMLADKLAGVMPAHVIYDQVDAQPAGFSRYWLQDVLRDQLGFNGLIFSDDLSMQGATVVGDMRQRAVAAIAAGCDMVLVCNDRDAAFELLQQPLPATSARSRSRLQAMLGATNYERMDELQRSNRWQSAQRWLERFNS
ncbi:beta-N-acetylhexosaminidase [Idiomarina fontislapidosi]|uniref:Beta-hexosaminidase n=1 Tax=Idiomarina fontislapidosi TaxID=263723 RepID=A0A432YBG2_9GAMM|nr:beta-N-acetylhexosaminidase [Idiomarina fontislapidosi]PYE35382.1 beta-N-acetylhexosaminidase [Idiomarina fontislapidosi]RUO58267.1 beta-N-acetylhexosaminidase [Idiomarina fontislapidosi]